MKLILILLFTIQGILNAQINLRKQLHSLPEENKYISNFNTDTKITWYQMFSNIPKDEYGFFAANLRQEKIPLYLSIGVLTGALVSFDHSSWEYTHNVAAKSPFLKSFSNYSVMLGNGGAHFIISGLFATYGFISHDKTALRTASNIAEAVLSTGLLVQVLKRITGRESPAAATYKSGIWDLFPEVSEYQGNQAKYYSFPSGHLASATATLTVIMNNYPSIKWIKPVGYSLLGLLSLTLVSRGMHWYSDLPLAYIIGSSMGNIISPVQNLDETNNKKRKGGQLTLFPSLGNHTDYLNISYSF